MKPEIRLKDRWVFHSLKFQLLARSLLVLAMLLAMIGVVQYLFMQQFLYHNKAAAIQSQALSIPRFFFLDRSEPEAQQQAPKPDDAAVHPRLFIPDAMAAFISLDGTYAIVSQSPDNHKVPKLKLAEIRSIASARGPARYRIVKDSTGTAQLVVVQQLRGRIGERGGYLQLSTPVRPLQVVLMRQLLTFLMLALAAMLLGVLAFVPVIRRTLVPLNKIVQTVEQIDAGNLAMRLPARQGQMEIDRLSESFNGMLKRLEDSFLAEQEAKEQMRRFVADASHELRTPLTSIHGFLEVLLRGAANHPDQLHKALTSMYGESERLNKLVRDLLLLARLDRSPAFEWQVGSLGEVVDQMESQLRLLAGTRQVRFALERNLICQFDADKMKQVVLNLFHNAIQHTDPDKGRIDVAVRRAKDGVELSVRDNGTGIPSQYLPHLFERFYRVDASRVRKHGGAGLGLAITQSIVHHHGGRIRVNSNEGEGSEFIVSLPETAGEAVREAAGEAED